LASPQFGAAKQGFGRTRRATHGCAVHHYADPLIVEQPKETAETIAGNENESHCAILAGVIEAVSAFRLFRNLVTKIPAQVHWQNRLLARWKGQLSWAVVRAC
jgi:hypothetical protein